MRLFRILAPSPLRFAVGVAVLLALGAAPASAASFVVDSTVDEPDADVRDYQCLSRSRRCTLRAAVEQANYIGGMYGISLSSATYTLRSPLDIKTDIRIGGRTDAVIDCQNATTAFAVTGQLHLSGTSVRRCQGIVNRGFTFLSGVRLEGNSGPIWNYRELWVSGCTFSENRAVSPIPGGAIVNEEDAYTTVFESHFEGNGSDTDGGAIVNRGEMDVIIVRFENNSAARGGAIHNSGNLWLQLSTFQFNEGNDGGAVFNRGEALVYQSGFVHNRADSRGGAIWSGAPLQLVSSTVSGNLANQGGGLYGEGEPNSLYLANATITENLAVPIEGPADVAGGGLYGAAILRNTILARNESNGKGQDCFAGPTSQSLSQGYNIIGILDDCGLAVDQGDQTGDLGSPFDPQLLPLDDTTWWPPFHPLDSQSPAVDRGDPNRCRMPVTEDPIDLDQLERPRHQGEGCDIGAVELTY
jgi:CSLREA domain-containing protein